MFPMGIRIWDKNRMIYPVKFSVYLNLEKNISSIKTLIEGQTYQTFNYMMLTTGIAINGYIYEKDIVMIDGEEDKVGIVEFDKNVGAFVVKIKEQIFIINETMEFCEILGNLYEDSNLLKEYSLSFKDEIIENDFNINDDFDEPAVETVAKTTEEISKKDIIKEPNTIDKIIKNEIPKKTENISEKLPEPKIEAKAIIKEEKIVEEPIIEKISEPVIEEITVEEPVIEQVSEPVIEEVIIKEVAEPIIEEIVVEEPIIEEIIPEVKEEDITEADLIDLPAFDSLDDIEEPLDVPLDDTFIPETDLLDEMEEPTEELPPDDVFGDEVATITKEIAIEADEISIYSFGHCAIDNGPGTYCFIINADGKEVVESANGLDSTILNRIQLMGVIEAFKKIKDGGEIKVYSDSKYVISPFIKGWIYKWQQNDWKKDSDNKVLNSDLWEEIYELTKEFSIQWIIIKDINTVPELVKCSEKARKEIEKFIK